MRKAYRTQFVHNFNIYDMKKWFTLIGLCCLMTGMISATNQPLKRISPVQAAQMRLGVLNEGTTRMEGTVRPVEYEKHRPDIIAVSRFFGYREFVGVSECRFCQLLAR